MPTFVVLCLDKPQSLGLRMATREAHLVWLRKRLDQVKLGGPITDDAGAPAGTLIIVKAADLAAAEAFAAGDPYAKAGLFETVFVKPFRAALGQL